MDFREQMDVEVSLDNKFRLPISEPYWRPLSPQSGPSRVGATQLHHRLAWGNVRQFCTKGEIWTQISMLH